MLKGKKGVNFATEINIIRTMNTLIAIYCEIKKETPLSLSRLGTQPLENLFGQIRTNTQKESNWGYLKSSIVFTFIARIFKEEFGIKSKIRGRVGTGGARLCLSDFTKSEITMDADIDIDNFMNFLLNKYKILPNIDIEEYSNQLKIDPVYQFFLQLC